MGSLQALGGLIVPETYLWHDYESFGADPRRDRPAQFAAIRTDAELNPVGEPLSFYCRPPLDYVPDAEACLITGITPQLAWQQGVAESEFARRIEAALALPDTIGVGYNSIRFDDELTRFLFWRNLLDPYAREWQNGCSRWDLLDVMRCAWALRPQGIEWPRGEDGKPSFRLEKLSAANGLAHEHAHDALSDVRATVALARLLRARQPRLYDFCLQLRHKARVAEELGLPTTLREARPFLHVSGRFGTERGCLALMWPLAMHPRNKNELLAWDLAQDPAQLADLTPEQARLRLFTASAQLPEGVTRLPVKGVHLNKSPIVIRNLKTLAPERAERFGIDFAVAERHAQAARALPDLSALWEAVYARRDEGGEPPVAEEDLYGGFVGDADRRRLARLRGMSAQELAHARTGFDDARLADLLFRYRARNFAESLNAEERARWDVWCYQRLVQGQGGARTLEGLQAQVDALSDRADERGELILGALIDWADALAPEG